MCADMRRPVLADQLAPFEVFGSRELPIGRPIVARLVGRRFDRLLDGGAYERPYDARFGKAMVKTVTYLSAALGASFGFAELTELSLFAVANGGDARRLLSRIAGEASGKLSLLIGEVATFEARLYELPDAGMALEYFRWRQLEAYQRAIDRYALHVLSQSGADLNAVPRILDGLGPDEKVELMRQNSLDFQTVPSWQRRGASVRIRPSAAEPGAGGAVRLLVDLNLPFDGEFADYLRQALV
jgi:tRNA(His) 5'-end guanylyltransferase